MPWPAIECGAKLTYKRCLDLVYGLYMKIIQDILFCSYPCTFVERCLRCWYTPKGPSRSLDRMLICPRYKFLRVKYIMSEVEDKLLKDVHTTTHLCTPTQRAPHHQAAWTTRLARRSIRYYNGQYDCNHTGRSKGCNPLFTWHHVSGCVKDLLSAHRA